MNIHVFITFASPIFIGKKQLRVLLHAFRLARRKRAGISHPLEGVQLPDIPKNTFWGPAGGGPGGRGARLAACRWCSWHLLATAAQRLRQDSGLFLPAKAATGCCPAALH